MGSVIKKRGRPVGSRNRARKPKTAKQFDWEGLARQLEEALKEEIRNNNELSEKVSDLNFQASNLVHQAIGYRAIISYLENKFQFDSK
jgi:hypothetical protein